MKFTCINLYLHRVLNRITRLGVIHILGLWKSILSGSVGRVHFLSSVLVASVLFSSPSFFFWYFFGAIYQIMHSFLVVKLISKICLLVLWHFSLYYEIFVPEIHICCDFFPSNNLYF